MEASFGQLELLYYVSERGSESTNLAWIELLQIGV